MSRAFARETLKVSAQNTLYDIGKGVVGAIWLERGSKWFASIWSGHVTAWQAGAVGIIVALLLPFPALLFIYWRWGKEKNAPRPILHGMVIREQAFGPTQMEFKLSGQSLADF